MKNRKRNTKHPSEWAYAQYRERAQAGQATEDDEEIYGHNAPDTECHECEGTGKRSFSACDELVGCVDCDGTGKVCP